MSQSKFSVQTRSEESGIRNFSTLAEALEKANKDRTVWKISFSLPTGERVRLIAIEGPEHPNWTYENLVDQLQAQDDE